MQTIHKNNITIFISDISDGSSRDDTNVNFSEFFFVEQVRGDEIFVCEGIFPERRSVRADAIITDVSGVRIGVELADCNGIIIWGKEYVAIIHAGWQGLEKKIIEKSIAILLEKGEKIVDLQVFVGPSIRSCCYEVGEEFLQKFDPRYFHHQPSGKYHFDMIACIQDSLVNVGISLENVEIHDACTKCDSSYYSYRKGNVDERFVVGVGKR